MYQYVVRTIKFWWLAYEFDIRTCSLKFHRISVLLLFFCVYIYIYIYVFVYIKFYRFDMHKLQEFWSVANYRNLEAEQPSPPQTLQHSLPLPPTTCQTSTTKTSKFLNPIAALISHSIHSSITENESRLDYWWEPIQSD